MKKITILALHLGYGGTEKYIATIANILSEKYDVEIIATYKLLDKPPFEIEKRVKISYLINDLSPNREEFKRAIKDKNIKNIFVEIKKGLKMVYLSRKLMIDTIKKLDSDIIFSTRVLHNKWSSKYGKKEAIKITSEHRYHNSDNKYTKALIKSCKNIDYFMPVSKQLLDFYKPKFQNTKTKCVYIPHCLDEIPINISSLDNKEIIAIGRLSKEKGFLDLIDVFSEVNKIHDDWHLSIIGDGPVKEDLINKTKLLDCQNKITFYGYQDKKFINEKLLNSSLYIMTSFEESFGLVLIEACAYGIPCLAFDSAEGAKEIITDNYNGYLVENRNKEVMVNKVISLIENKNIREKLGKNSRAVALMFSKEKISKLWLKFIAEIEE